MHGPEGIAKLKELAEDIDVCLFCTNVTGMPFEMRPMSTQEVDEEGNIWFFSARSSNKNNEIRQDDKVQLIYSKLSDSHFLTVYGTADEVFDQERIDRYWDKFIKAWFPGGKEDPDLALIRVKPIESHYWDTKDGKMVSIFKIAIAAITGKEMDGGIEGDIKV